ncbi:MAG: Type II secretion system protein G [Candidatus Roizmanbacteria bacterium GW2011_GWA2_35_19]|uniref:Type II secretion system protein G n=2 Tax=Candidatus Roizmaniibacteriota TaxID=1752723 RepID=A0A0G0EYT3_9BACT|nr:MAG: Type II secretion system protein G [Candidatus Roizmanbacteria bacterium GW2011_GWC2_35_12]KKP72327.1 MAG: Type II secretion system protein G [Candidatus Roizmanbacteria bacterium GW2011_GWA2_35_19]
MKKKGLALSSPKGFTLIELIIVIVILGILAALISGNFITSLKKGRDARRKGDLEQIKRALEMYYEDKRAYPAELTVNEPLTDPDSTKIYMQKIPGDPITGLSYGYEVETGGTYYRLYACLENKQQILPYISPLNMTIIYPCTNTCKDQAGTAYQCVWGTSSTNESP